MKTILNTYPAFCSIDLISLIFIQRFKVADKYYNVTPGICRKKIGAAPKEAAPYPKEL